MTTNQLITKIGRQRVLTALSNVVCNSSASSVAFSGITGAPGDNAALAAALALKLDSLFTQYEKTDNYTLLAADLTAVNAGENVLYVLNTGTAKNFTVPLNATIAFPVGTILTLLRIGAGQWTVVATGGVTVTGSAGVLTDSGQNQFMVLTKTATNTWYLANGAASSGGSGDVVGPAGATDGSLAEFDGTTGKLLKDGLVALTAYIKTLLVAASASAARILLGGVPWTLYNTNVSIVISGVTAETKLTLPGTFLIPGGTLQANDVIEVDGLFTRTSGAVANATFRLYFHTADQISGATQVMQSAINTAQSWGKFHRDIIMKNDIATQVMYSATNNQNSDEVAINLAKTTRNIDFAVDQYIVASIQTTNGDTINFEWLRLRISRYS